LTRAVTTLREQLTEVRTWEKQPTFYLTIACMGIAEALESEDPSAGAARVETLPAFRMPESLVEKTFRRYLNRRLPGNDFA